MRTALLALVLVPFTAYSVSVASQHGFFGFLTLSLREPWAMQMFLDLCISLLFFGAWIRRDARKHDISALPFLVLLPFLGSIAALGYLVRRELKGGAALAVSR